MEMRKVCAFVLGVREAQLPIPFNNWSSFEFVVGILNRKEGSVVYDCGSSGSWSGSSGGGGTGGVNGNGLVCRTWLDLGVMSRVYGPVGGESGGRGGGVGHSQGGRGGGVDGGRGGSMNRRGEGGRGLGDGRAGCTVQ